MKKLIALLLCGAFSGLMAVSQASPIAQRMIGMTPAAAAIALNGLWLIVVWAGWVLVSVLVILLTGSDRRA